MLVMPAAEYMTWTNLIIIINSWKKIKLSEGIESEQEKIEMRGDLIC